MLGSLICPIVWTLAIRQVVRQPLPRVTPEKAYSEVPHQYRWSYYPTPVIHSWLASLCNLLSQIGGAYIGFLRLQVLSIYTIHLHALWQLAVIVGESDEILIPLYWGGFNWTTNVTEYLTKYFGRLLLGNPWDNVPCLFPLSACGTILISIPTECKASDGSSLHHLLNGVFTGVTKSAMLVRLSWEDGCRLSVPHWSVLCPPEVYRGFELGGHDPWVCQCEYQWDQGVGVKIWYQLWHWPIWWLIARRCKVLGGEGLLYSHYLFNGLDLLNVPFGPNNCTWECKNSAK